MSRMPGTGSVLRRRTLVLALVAGALVIGLSSPVAAEPHHELEGTFSGAQTLGFFDPRCPATAPTYFTNVTVFTFDVHRGPAWRYRADACSFITGTPAMVTTAGTFTVAAPGGTLTGDFSITRRVDADTLDIEQVLHITGGTGRFQRAEGACVLTDFVTSPLVITGLVGRSDFAGSVTCSITRARAG